MSDRLIFSTSLYTMDALEFFLRERGWALGREYYRLDGSVPAEVRQKWCREFNAPHNTTTKQVSHQSLYIYAFLGLKIILLIVTNVGNVG